MELNEAINIWLESSASSILRDVLISGSNHFTLVNSSEEADIILFGDDKPSYVRKIAEFRRYPEKCLVISETDEPSHFLPACYASNRRFWLSYKRTRTIPYYLSQQASPNPFVEDFTDSDQQRYLYSFRGGSTSWLRKRLFKLLRSSGDVCIEEANHYYHWNYEESYAYQKLALQRQYADLIEQSLFFLCPRGVGVSSIRLFEVMKAGRAPVIIADDWVPIADIPWNECSIQIVEKDLLNVDRIIRARKHEAHVLGLKARQAWLNYCSPDAQSEFLRDSIQIIQRNRDPRREQFLQSVFPFLEAITSGKTKARSILKYFILRGFALTGRKFPYSLNRPLEDQIRR